jgi:hypothetical protein
MSYNDSDDSDESTIFNSTATDEVLQSDNRFAEAERERQEERLQDVERLVERKITLAQADDLGLGEDPAVEELRGHVEREQADLGLIDVDPADRLTEEYGLEETVVGRLGEGEREELLDHLAAVDELEQATRGAEDHFMRLNLLDRREKIAELAAANDVRTAALAAPHVDVTQTAALAGDPTDVEIGAADSESVKAAKLRDRLEDVEERIENADTKFTEAALLEDKEDLEARLADVEG